MHGNERADSPTHTHTHSPRHYVDVEHSLWEQESRAGHSVVGQVQELKDSGGRNSLSI